MQVGTNHNKWTIESKIIIIVRMEWNIIFKYIEAHLRFASLHTGNSIITQLYERVITITLEWFELRL